MYGSDLGLEHHIEWNVCGCHYPKVALHCQQYQNQMYYVCGLAWIEIADCVHKGWQKGHNFSVKFSRLIEAVLILQSTLSNQWSKISIRCSLVFRGSNIHTPLHELKQF